MTTGVLNQRQVTVRDVLFNAAPGDAPTALSARLDERGVYAAAETFLAGLSLAAKDELRTHIVELADQMLGADVVHLVVAGWRKQRELVQAAQATLASPEKMAFVDLSSQRITSTDNWTVDVVVDRAPVARFDFALTVVFEVEAIVAVLRAGKLVGLRGGKCDIGATLEANHRELISQHRPFDLGARVSFGPGIPLCRIPADADR
jgi:hypothetical protein